MPESDYYESSYRRGAAYMSDDDNDRYKRTTVHRYKVGPDRVERIERDQVEEIDTDRRPARRSSNNLLLDVDRRTYAPERPRSALDVTEHTRRNFYDDRGDTRTVEKRREVIDRDDGYGGDRSQRVVYEKTKEIDRDGDRRPRDRDSYTRVQGRGNRDDQIVVESYSTDRRDDGYGGKVERWQRETEYYEPASPPPAPIVIRPKPAEQKIILQEAPAPAPVIVPHQSPGVVVIREKDLPPKKEPREEEDYYYRRERREVGPYRGDREEDLAIERFDDRDDHRRHHHHHHHRKAYRDYASDGEASEDEYYTKTVIRREASPPESQHRLQLAEGALAGAGIGALLGSRRNGDGDLPEHRGRKVLAGAALGALGTEVLKRAHSAYNERYGDDGYDDDRDRGRNYDRNRSRSSSRHHSKLKTGLGIAAAALAVAGAAKYIQSNRIDNEERNRGRSLHRYSSDEGYDNSRSRSRTSRKSRSRAASVAKVAAGTAAVAGLVHHYRSKSRGKSRSKSRLRTGAEIAAAGLVGAAVKKMYDKRQDKKEREREEERDQARSRERERERERDRELDEDDEEDRRSRHSARSGSRSRSRSRSRSEPRVGSTRSFSHGNPPPSGADPELGLVEYGAQPLYSDPPYPESVGSEAGRRNASYDSAANDSGRSDRRRHRHHHNRSRDYRSASYSGSVDDMDDGSYADGDDDDRRTPTKKDKKKNRSRSRLRDLAAAGAGAAAAAIGIKKYEDKKIKREEESRSPGRDDRDARDDRSRDRDRNRDRLGTQDGDSDRYPERSEHRRRDRRDRSRRRAEDDNLHDDYYDNFDSDRPPSPPHASGGAYYPPPPAQGPPPPSGFMQHSNMATTNLNEAAFQPYNPADYTGYPPPPPGPPPTAAAPVAAPPAAGPPVPVAVPPTTFPPATFPPATFPPATFPPATFPLTTAVPPPTTRAPPAADPVPVSGPPAAATEFPYTPPPVHDNPNDIIIPEPQAPPHDRDHVSFAIPVSSQHVSLPSDSSKLREAEPVASEVGPPPPPYSDGEGPDAQPKAVSFIPLSPKSSRTLRRHHAEIQDHDHDHDASSSVVLPMSTAASKGSDGSRALIPDSVASRDSGRRASDPSSDRPAALLQLPRNGSAPVSDDDTDEEVIEVLPDRFDSHGRPLESSERLSSSTGKKSSLWNVRRGDFEYRNPKENGWHMQGQWGVAGTKAGTVESMAEGMKDIIHGLGQAQSSSGVFGVLSGVLGALDKSNHLLGDDSSSPGNRSGRDDDRKRKRKNAYRGRRSIRRSASLDSYDDHYNERDDYGHDSRRKRRSWGS